MKNQLFIINAIMITLLSCDPETTQPQNDCTLLSTYNLSYHGVDAPKVFDIRSDPPLEIKNGTIEYDLFLQWVFLHDDNPVPYPYSQYFIDSLDFSDSDTAITRIFEIGTLHAYQYERNDCQIDLGSSTGNLHFELTKNGEDISEKRFAIYNHKLASPTRDTFLFLEFRLGHFSSYEEIIKQFAMDNQGKYDTIAIERVQNRSK